MHMLKKKKKKIFKMLVFLSVFYSSQILEIHKFFIHTIEKKYNIRFFIYIYIYETNFFFFKFKSY